jgi:hypothetical protein
MEMQKGNLIGLPLYAIVRWRVPGSVLEALLIGEGWAPAKTLSGG